MLATLQERSWAGCVGSGYTDRCIFTAGELDQCYLRGLGVTRANLNLQFLKHLPRFLRILEVGCNIGMQLRHLQLMGFWNLHGIELQQYALSRLCVERVEACQGSATDLPYSDESFDLVFTSGVLIHIPPSDLPLAISEILRCTRRYVWGFEYFSEAAQGITWREQENMMWAADYAALFLDLSPNLALTDSLVMPYLNPDQDGLAANMYMLEKQ